jgi:hypothetical protein
MRDLFLSEWRRFRGLALLVAGLHALALAFLSRVTFLLQRGADDHLAMLLLYLLLGLALAAVQVGSYRRPSQWLWLVHRPLPPARIFAALALAALALLALAVLLPLAGFVLLTDLATTQVVDARHYGALLHVLAFTAMAWLAGAHACISRHPVTVLVLLAPLVLALHLASVWTLLGPTLFCLAWLAWITLHGFRPDRSAPIARAAVLLPTAIALQLGFFVLGFQLARGAVGAYELARQAAPGRTVLEGDPEAETLQRNFAQDFLFRGLDGSGDPRAPLWREQLPLLEVAELSSDLERFPLRHQFGNLDSPRWDESRGLQWNFSHDAMRYHGRNPTSGDVAGWWGTRGAGEGDDFDAVPLGNLTPSTLYAVDGEAQRQHELLRLPDGERFVGAPVAAFDRLLVLTDRHVRAYAAPADAVTPFAARRLDWSLPLPAGDPRPVHVSVAELLDGWLVSVFHYAGPEFEGFDGLVRQSQRVWYVDADGTATPVAPEREIRGHSITLGGSPRVPQAAWWLSPPLYLLARAPEALLELGLVRRTQPLAWPMVPRFVWLAAGGALLSLLLAAWWLRGTGVAPARRALWLLLCVLAGLPGLCSLLCLEPRRRRP